MLPFEQIQQRGELPIGAVVMPDNHATRRGKIDAAKDTPSRDGEHPAETTHTSMFETCLQRVLDRAFAKKPDSLVKQVISEVFESERERILADICAEVPTSEERLRKLYKKRNEASWEELGFK